MNYKGVSKMLGYLKYHAAEKNKDQEDQKEAKDALIKYSSLNGMDKQMFLLEYEKNKGSSLKWARSFVASSVEKTESKTSAQLVCGVSNPRVAC